MFLSKISIHSCIIILYTVKKKIKKNKNKKNCRHCLQFFSTQEMLKHYIKDCFEINGKQRIIIPKKCETVKLKKYERKIKSPFIVLLIF